MRKISIIALVVSLFASAFAAANEVNIFNARHYKADMQSFITSLQKKLELK
jgi:hypothetical protein